MRLTAKIGNERFRFGGNREPKFMWSLVIGHLWKLLASQPANQNNKHNASRCAVTGITARKEKGPYNQVRRRGALRPQNARPHASLG